MLFGTKTVKNRRSVQHCCLSVHSVMLYWAVAMEFVDIWIWWGFVFCRFVCGLLGFCGVQWVIFVTFRWQCVSTKRRNIHLLHSAGIRKKDQRSHFAEFLLRIANLHTILHAQLLRASLYECVSEWQGFRAECIKWKNRSWLYSTSSSYN